MIDDGIMAVLDIVEKLRKAQKAKADAVTMEDLMAPRMEPIPEPTTRHDDEHGDRHRLRAERESEAFDQSQKLFEHRTYGR